MGGLQFGYSFIAFNKIFEILPILNVLGIKAELLIYCSLHQYILNKLDGHIVPELSEGTWWSSHSVMHFFGSSGAKDQLPGH